MTIIVNGKQFPWQLSRRELREFIVATGRGMDREAKRVHFIIGSAVKYLKQARG